MRVEDNCYPDNKTPDGEVKSIPHEIEKGLIKSLIISNKNLDIWAPSKLTKMSERYVPTEPGDHWYTDLAMIVKPRNVRLQKYMNNEWTAFHYIYRSDLEDKAKNVGLTPIEKPVKKYLSDEVKASHEVKYVD